MMRSDIEKRRTETREVNGKTVLVVIRELSCGHEQVEPKGGKSRLVMEVNCKECKESKKS